MKASGLEELIKKYNPFGFKGSDGEIKMFEDYGKAYLYALEKLHELFPRGYIDVPLFLHMMTGQPLAVCMMFTHKSSFLKTVNKGVLICEPVKGVPPKEQYENLMKAMHTLSETQFSQDYFNWAWEEFEERL